MQFFGNYIFINGIFKPFRLGGKPGAVTKCTACQGRGIKVSYRMLGPGMVQHMQSACPDCCGEGMNIFY